MSNNKSLYRVYLNEYNLLMGKGTYLPLVSGILQANAIQSEIVQQYFQFMPFHFHINNATALIESHDKPAIAGFSVSMWNEQLSLRVAEEVKRKFPDCLIVFGGAQVPHEAKYYLEQNGFIDLTVKGEGEESFRDILEHFNAGDGFGMIPGVTWRDIDGEIQANNMRRPFNQNLDTYPSPYLSGVYDELLASRPDMDFQAIIETNRGCPFKCVFCYWGMGGLSRKYRFHSLERVRDELEWMAQHKIRYIFNADSNFGAHQRDEVIAQMLVDIKKKFGYPEKFRTCYGKNTSERIFKIGSLLHGHQLEKGVTISYQSMDSKVQKNIKRLNIKVEVANELQKRFNERDVPVYTEMILGLPGESTQSWKQGVNRVLDAGLKNQLFLYICVILPNTDLSDSLYRQLHGIKSQKIELTEIHVSPRDHGWINEFEEIVIETASMSVADWREMLIFSWATMLFHGLKIAFFIMVFLRREFGIPYSEVISCLSDAEFEKRRYPVLTRLKNSFIEKVDRILSGEGRGIIYPGADNIYWEQEEVAFIDICIDHSSFYIEFKHFIDCILSKRGISCNKALLEEVVNYQRLRMPCLVSEGCSDVSFRHNIPEYFDNILTTCEVDLNEKPQILSIHPKQFDSDLAKFTRESILWGRKSGNFLTPVNWINA